MFRGYTFNSVPDIVWSSEAKRPERLETPACWIILVPLQSTAAADPSRGSRCRAVNSSPVVVPVYMTNHGLSMVIAPFERVTVISRSEKTTPVKLSRCRRTQQLSAPVTETKRCVTVQFVVGDETVGEGAEGVGVVGDDGVGDEEPLPHAVKSSAAVASKM